MNQNEDDIYREQLIELYKNPMHKGKLESAVEHEDYNPLCGDRVKVYIKFENSKIKEIKFEGRGCVISQVAADLIAEEAIGKTKKDLDKMNREKILKLLGIDLSVSRIKCAMLGIYAIKKALLKVEK